MPRSKYIKHFVFPLLFSVAAISCASSYKARIDTTASGGILWPGAPEKPRIKYMWSLHNVGTENDAVDDKSANAADAETTPDDGNSGILKTLQKPQSLYVDDVRYYIADPGAARVTVIDRKTLDVFHITDAGSESLVYPIGVVADSSGRIYVSDPEMKKVFVFSDNGDYLFSFAGLMERPTGIAINRLSGKIYVTDTLNHTVHIYGLDGQKTGSIGKRGDGNAEFNYPSHVCVDDKGMLYVTDFLNFRVQIFSPEGSFLKKFGRPGDSLDAFDKPKGVAVDSEGHIYVVDAGKDMVKIFDQKGNLLLYFGEQGHRAGDFYLPTGMFIDRNNVIYVADTINMRIQAFQFLGGD